MFSMSVLSGVPLEIWKNEMEAVHGEEFTEKYQICTLFVSMPYAMTSITTSANMKGDDISVFFE